MTEAFDLRISAEMKSGVRDQVTQSHDLSSADGWREHQEFGRQQASPPSKAPDDQAHARQKNGAVVRRMLGCRQLEGLEAAQILARRHQSMR